MYRHYSVRSVCGRINKFDYTHIINFSDADMRPTPLRRQGDQMLSAAGAASGGHTTPHCLPTKISRCALCERYHITTDHQCPVKGHWVGEIHPCPHGAARCANCGGPHGARVDACAFFFSFCLAELGGRISGSPARTDHFGLRRDLVKGGKMGCCPREQRQAAAMTLWATCSGIVRELIIHTSASLHYNPATALHSYIPPPQSLLPSLGGIW